MGYEHNKRQLQTPGLSQTVTATSVGTTMAWRGAKTVTSTGAGKLYYLDAPNRIGDEVRLYCTKGTTTNTAFVVLPTGYSFQLTSNSTGTTTRKVVFNAGNQWAHLVALSTSKVGVAIPSGVTLATT